MLTVPVPAEVHGDALEAELAAAGVAAVVQLIGDDLRIAADEADRPTVEQVVAAHRLPLPSPEQVANDDARTQLTALRTKAREVAAGNGTFTAVQVQKILAHLILRSTR